ncbi:hypothetical protein COO60DRAFT_291669 [Scenedesmus sp. NREL 46B-D3]|nr:hypothetical protein COO60DRAFT_291669 [Scenedesmus sp. NREL 46B-D3]
MALRHAGSNLLAATCFQSLQLTGWGATFSTSAVGAAPTTISQPRNSFSEVVIALGTNQGNRVDNLLDGLVCLTNHAVKVLRVSLLYETAPMYLSEQPPFLNAAVLGHTDLSPLQLLYHLKQIEKAAGEAPKPAAAAAAAACTCHCISNTGRAGGIRPAASCNCSSSAC